MIPHPPRDIFINWEEPLYTAASQPLPKTAMHKFDSKGLPVERAKWLNIKYPVTNKPMAIIK